jgi:hypothetical protein
VELLRGRFQAARAPDGPAATPVQERAFGGLIALYNALEKPRQWARQSPWLTLWDDPALLGLLVHADRPFGLPPELALYQGRAWARLLAHSFIRSRAFALRPPEGGPACQVLLPLLDALDHHADAGRFTRTHAPGAEGAQVPALTVPEARPVAGSDACRVAYNVLDAQQSLLHYGFLDESAAYLLSVPLRVPLGGGASLHVLAATGRYAEPLPPERAPLRAWLPRVLRAPPEVLAVTRLPLPPARQADTLHAVLETLIARRWPLWSAARRAEAAAAAANGLLAVNQRYHARTAELLTDAHARSGRGDVPGRRATLAALDRLAARADAHFAAT